MGPEREGTWRSSGVGDGRAIGCLEVSPRGIFDSSRGADVLFRLFCMGFQSGCLAGTEFSSAKKKNHRRSCVALASRRLPTIFQSLRGARHLTTAPKATEQDGSGLEARYVCLPAGRRGRPRAPPLLERGRLRLSPSCHETRHALGLPLGSASPRPPRSGSDLAPAHHVPDSRPHQEKAHGGHERRPQVRRGGACPSANAREVSRLPFSRPMTRRDSPRKEAFFRRSRH